MIVAPPTICPSCGLDLRLDQPITRDGIEIDPRRREVRWRGEPVHLQPSAFTMLYALVKAAGCTLSHGALMERTGSAGLWVDKGVGLRIHQIGRALPGVPIISIFGEGYAWRPDDKESSS